MEKEPASGQAESDSAPKDAQRREALRKLALYGAYTAPALLGLLNAEKAVAQTAAACDGRLKCNISLVETRSDGLRLHAFSYLGDERRFVGPIAQELLSDPKFAGAVIPDECGFLRVDFAALGLRVPDLPAMSSAGDRALSAFRS